ncbi:MAG: DUF2264 domain-containing protein [Lachnospiraceae bacterium]|nr:DUF2264 domain-containing protein [Lachnospiraceae bacterium]
MRRYRYTEKDFSTKDAAQAALMRLLAPLKPFYSESGARLEIGVTSAHYESDTVPMEAFARPLWGLAPFWAGGGRDERSSGKSERMRSDSEKSRAGAERDDLTQYRDFEEIYNNGLSAGADPAHPEYWHTCRDFDQKFCEMAAIAYAMLLAPEQVWDSLSDEAKKNLTEWLWEINRHECCACNWQWFAIVTNLALKVRGMPYSRERMETGLAMLEDYYDAGGWYRDGNGGEKDYYNPFVMVSYGLLYAMFMEEEEPERCAAFRQRARDFAQDYIYWFADDGASIAYGRSMTYRFAQGGFFAFALLSGTEVLPLSVIKGILTRHLTWWLNQPIYDNAGILTIGYAYPNLQMSESYNAPGSPYWALLAFAFLALPDDHPYWQADCAPMPELERQHYLAHAGMLMQRNHNNVVALLPGRLHADGHSHTLEKYGKFAYSSRFGFSISRSPLTLYESAPDSTLVFEIGGRYYPRDTIEEDYTIDSDGITCVWSPLPVCLTGAEPLQAMAGGALAAVEDTGDESARLCKDQDTCAGGESGSLEKESRSCAAGVPYIRVETEIRPTEKGHIRTHRITSEIECAAYDCGFALAAERGLAVSGNDQGVVSGESACGRNVRVLENESFAAVETMGDYCTVTVLSGDGKGQVLTPDPNTNLIVPKTFLPMAAYKIRKGTQVIQTEVCYL